ncbi:hypothetical protein [uncultured Methanoregula sp.]|uniref:hypothetical protein n=1 Tax=uncultured Methanoregula sp. TaxID=1005933 RepID=UPI002AABEED7|nr:hypothetical protein [uncultured Methanoregula sp.]
MGRICDLETTDEKLLKLREILYPEIEQKLLISQSVSLKHCVEFSGMHEYRDPSLAETLFMQYAKEKHLTVKNIPPMGPVIVIQT